MENSPSRPQTPTPPPSVSTSASSSRRGGGGLCGLCTRLYGRCTEYVALPDDTPVQAVHKHAVLTFSPIMILIGAVMNVLHPVHKNPWIGTALLFLSASALGVLLKLLVTRTVSRTILQVWIILSVFFVLVPVEMNALAEMTTRLWAVGVIFVDICLIYQLGDKTAFAVVALVSLWLAFAELNRGVDTGLIVRFTDEKGVPACECANPPCFGTDKISDLAAAFLTQLSIFLLDFYITRSFARKMHREKLAIAASVETARCLATHLSLFDLDSAQRLLDSCGDGDAASVDGGASGAAAAAATATGGGGQHLPPALRSAFEDVLSNLRSYKPYLPQAMLMTADDLGSSLSSPPRFCDVPPGDGDTDPHVGVAFTDIKGSTGLWEYCPSAMGQAMVVHNRVIRRCIGKHEGYEVKTIGDAFMVAFRTSALAVRFGLDVQQGLHEAEWPSELVEWRGPLRPGQGWPGLRVRVGVHYGPVTMDFSGLTERMDYLGPTVNRAARLEGAAYPGSVAVLADMYAEQRLDEALGDSVCAWASEATELRGLQGEHSILALLPAELSRLRDGLTEPEELLEGEGADECGGSEYGGRSRNVSALLAGATMLNATVPPTRCTVGLVQLEVPEYSEHGWGTARDGFLDLVVLLRRTEGTLNSVSGLCVLASWGLGKRSGTHVSKAFRFAGLLQEWPKNECAVTCGLSTGLVSGCHVGDWEARFLAYGGRCLSICWALCALAQRLRADVLYATANDGNADPSVIPALRPLVHVEAGVQGVTAVAYELCGRRATRIAGLDEDVNPATAEARNTAQGGGGGGGGGCALDSWGWSRECSALFHAGNYEAIEQRAAGDAVLERAARYMRNNPPPPLTYSFNRPTLYPS